MTLCAFAANDTSETVVAANVSGKAAIVNVNTGKVTKISAPTEVQSISVSDSGVIALSEYRGFRTQFYDIDRIGTLLFFGWAKYVDQPRQFCRYLSPLRAGSPWATSAASPCKRDCAV
ncbi:MAG: hypothetical protein ACLRTQ_01015 [Candidatus Borkfalkia sp.]